MVTVRAKQDDPHQNQQQGNKYSRESENLNEEATVADDDSQNHQQQQQRRINNEKNGNGVKDNWTIDKYDPETLKNYNNHNDDKREIALIEKDVPVRFLPEATDNNCESARSSEIADNNVYLENERNEELCLAEEEEEEVYVAENNVDDDEKTDGWVRRKVVTTRVQHEATSGFDDNDNGGTVDHILPNLDETTFGEVSITNSRHVHVGNTNFYKGPVTIKQFVYTNAYPVQDAGNSVITSQINGDRSRRISGINGNGLSQTKSEPNGLPSSRDYERVTKLLWTWRCAAILCVLALILVSIVAVIFTQGNKFGIPDSPTSGINPDDILVDSVRFIERDMWSAQPSKKPLDKLQEVPTPYVIISHTVQNPCKMQSECVLRVRMAQTLHIESFGWSDIGYNFLVGGDGNAYVGRGWDYEGAHAFGYNRKSIGISFIGTFNDVAPYKRQLHAAIKVIEIGVKLGKISPTYKLLGHRQVTETLSPGDELYKIIKTWDHWSPEPEPSRATSINRSTLFLLYFLFFTHYFSVYFIIFRPQ